MSHPHTEIPARAPAATSADDTILPFKVEALDLRGRVVRFGPAIDTILSRHSYPAPVAKLLGEGIVLTVLLGLTFTCAIEGWQYFLPSRVADVNLNFRIR